MDLRLMHIWQEYKDDSKGLMALRMKVLEIMAPLLLLPASSWTTILYVEYLYCKL